MLQDKVIQFGEGNFLRGFVDWMVERLNARMGLNAGVTIIQPLPEGKVADIMAQNGEYTLVLRGLQNGQEVEEISKIHCITKGINPYENWESYLNLAKVLSYRVIVSNTTEAGIEFKKEDKESAPYVSFPAKLALLLKKRFDLGLEGFIILPCELIDKNGDHLKDCILKYAAYWNFGEEFKNWVVKRNHFLNTLVDRIVTGYPITEASQLEERLGYKDPCLNTAEIFHLWVIEGDPAIAEAISLNKIGLNVILTKDAAPYKARKVRILNGAHTMMVPAAILAGLETVKEAMDDSLFHRYLKKGIFEEIIPTLDLPKQELEQFAKDILERFSNPFIKHYLSAIALNSISKYKVRVLPSLLEFEKRTGKKPPLLTFSLAALIVYYKTCDVNDEKSVKEFMKNTREKEIIASFCEDDGSVLEQIERIKKLGIRKVMEDLVE